MHLRPACVRRVGIALLLLPGVPAHGACPGTSACQLNLGCGPTAIVVGPGASLQGAINSAPSGSTICVLPGTYSGKFDFHGKAITLVSQSGPVQTILQGSGSPSGPVVTFQTFEAADSVLDGFGIRGGTAPFGGGIYIANASPTIRNCIVSGNGATGNQYSRGGGIWVTGATSRPSLRCLAVNGNFADYAGGGLASAGSADPFLRESLFSANRAKFGAAIAVHLNGRLDVATTQFLDNNATTDGGAIHSGNTYGNVLVRRCWFKNNSAVSKGGAMWVPAGLAEVTNSTFEGNRAKIGGALASGYGGMVSVASTIFVRNTSTSGGSAALADAFPASSNTSVVNHYNGFFANTGGAFSNTYGNLGLVLADPLLGTCCPGPGSPAIDAGIPDVHFLDPNQTRNDMGACGGPPP